MTDDRPTQPPADENKLIAERRAKLDKLRERASRTRTTSAATRSPTSC